MNLADLFTVAALTASINKTPLPPSLIGSSGLFQEKGVRTTSIDVDVVAGRLVLVNPISRNADPQPKQKASPTSESFTIPHMPVSGSLLPQDLQDLRAFGEEATEAGLIAPAQVINDELELMKASLEATREYQRIGAIKGLIVNADGSTLYDLYAKFNITKKTANFALATTSTKVRGLAQAISRHVDQKASGLLVTRRRAYCGATFFDALVDHESVRPAYEGYQEAQDRLGGDVRAGFVFGGIEWIDYSAQIGTTKFVADTKAHVFPVAAGAFITRNAPANYNEAVNTVGLPFYAKAEERRMGKGWDLEAQSNTLSLALALEAHAELTAT